MMCSKAKQPQYFVIENKLSKNVKKMYCPMFLLQSSIRY